MKTIPTTSLSRLAWYSALSLCAILALSGCFPVTSSDTSPSPTPQDVIDVVSTIPPVPTATPATVPDSTPVPTSDPVGAETGDSTQDTSDPRPSDPAAGLVYGTGEELWVVDEQGGPIYLGGQPAAQLSPDGTQLCYLAPTGQEGADEIWLADLTTGELRNLTNSPDRFEVNPVWWPARPEVIIFGSDVRTGMENAGYLSAVGLDGTGYQVLDPEEGGPFALSPDGQMIAYGSYDHLGKIYRWGVGPELFDPAQYGLSVEKLFQPAWSPNGRYLAWKVVGDLSGAGAWEQGIAVFDLETVTAQLVHVYEPVGGGTFPHFLSWSSDGEWLAFVTFGEPPAEGRMPNLWVTRGDGTEEIHLGAGVEPTWSPNGRWLAFLDLAQEGGGGIELVEAGTWVRHLSELVDARTIRGWVADPPAAASVIPPSQPEPDPVSDPEGRLQVAFNNNGDLWLWDEESGASAPLTGTGDVWQFQISPDGRMVAFARGDELWAINSDGDGERQLVPVSYLDQIEPQEPHDDQAKLYQFDWLPGTHTLVFNTRLDTQIGLILNDDLHVVNADTLELVELLSPGQGGEFHPSPDGSSITIVTAESVSVVDTSGDNRRELFTYTPMTTYSEVQFYARPMWAPDSNSMMVAVPPADPLAEPLGPTIIWHLTTDGTEPRPVTSIDKSIPGSPVIAPDFSQVAYLQAPEGVVLGGGPADLVVSSLVDNATDRVSPAVDQLYGWSPDSQRLAFLTAAQAQIGRLGEVMPAADDPEAAVIEVSWVDSSRYLSLVGGRNQGWEIRLTTIGGSSLTLDTVIGMPPAYDYEFSKP